MHQTPEHRPSALMGSQISNQLELVTQPGRKMSKKGIAVLPQKTALMKDLNFC